MSYILSGPRADFQIYFMSQIWRIRGGEGIEICLSDCECTPDMLMLCAITCAAVVRENIERLEMVAILFAITVSKVKQLIPLRFLSQIVGELGLLLTARKMPDTIASLMDRVEIPAQLV